MERAEPRPGPDLRPLVLVVTSDDQHQYQLTVHLQREGFRTHGLIGDDDVMASIDRLRPDLVLVSQFHDAPAGIDTCSLVRQRSAVPVVMLTGWDAEELIEAGLRAGADHCVVWPQRRHEMVARLRAVLRRANGYRPGVFGRQPFWVGDLHIDPGVGKAFIGACCVPLTAAEFDVLETLALSEGRFVTKEALASRVWGEASDSTLLRLKPAVNRVRSKLDATGRGGRIVVVRGVGYRYDAHA
jgi:DNA-binding response OmpR family regulator